MQKLYTKLFAIQSKNISVTKDWLNPHFKSKYMTLDNIIETLQPFLAETKLLVTHFIENGTLTTRVVDIESGETLDSHFPMNATDPQKSGSEVTYWKRYNLVAIFSICADEDDDGNKASSLWNKYEKPILDQKTITDTIKKWKEWELTGTFDEFLEYLGKTHKVLDDQVARLKPLFPWI